ncbi:MAG: 2Fe-2S iron-sulfur cluster binding domain-containing protein, partial [Alphaproteobacteria bacterium]|nr:2Fe-2S iron-sulfur cluster binding domain-containing protein [Alphaproteobacteria bacterium]
YERREPNEKPMILDVLLQAQATTMPDLAFRYGCRARNCGVCTVDLNGKPRVACRARIREGDRISPVNTLPVLADLVVQRDGVARQMRDRLTGAAPGNDFNQDPPENYHELTACIECYACLQGCPMHARNLAEGAESDPGNGYSYGSPFSLLKLQLLRLDPLSTEASRERALTHAKELGLDACKDCAGCKCGVGIDLMGKVVRPMLAAVGE